MAPSDGTQVKIHFSRGQNPAVAHLQWFGGEIYFICAFECFGERREPITPTPIEKANVKNRARRGEGLPATASSATGAMTGRS